jgi:hypothetical protein
MQVRTPAGEPGLRVGLDDVPDCHEAKQAGLGRTLLAAYTGTRDGCIPGMLLGPFGHFRQQVYRVRASPMSGEPYASAGVSGGSDSSSVAASDLMSIRQPVSRAASLAFCPSLPMARDNW